MRPAPDIETLLNQARAIALEAIGEVPATKANLEILSRLVRENILTQADQGLWSKYKVKSRREFDDMTVKAVVNPSLVGPPIILEYDWSKTKFKFLQTKSVRMH